MTGALILAAGEASRMGSAKQLLSFQGKTLIARVTQVTLEALLDPVIVVTGAHHDAVCSAISALPVSTIWNERWQSGMGSSLKVGLAALLALTPALERIAVLLADQPLIQAKHLAALAMHLGNNDAVAAQAADTIGPPAIFNRRMFPAIAALPDESGARTLLRDGQWKVATCPLPEATCDVDTPSDWQSLIEAAWPEKPVL